MPAELSPTAVARALARLGEHDLEAVGDVEAALGSIAGREDPDAPLEISRCDLQAYLWYELPRRLLAPLAVKRQVATRLRRFLEFAGAPATYVELCTSAQTMTILDEYERDDPRADERLREALEASGLEPPDTELLTWRPRMGFEEAWLRDRLARELERWIEEEGIGPGGRGFKRRQAAFAAGFLRRPAAELEGRTPLEVIVSERLEHWARDGSEERAEIVAPVLPIMAAAAPERARVAAGDGEMLEPLVWLLERGAEGIGLTQTGALNRALVRSFAERFPGSWRADAWGPPHRERDVVWLCEVHDLARRTRLLRRAGPRLVLTRRGKQLLGDRAALRDAVAPSLIAADDFAGAVQELVVAVLLGGGATVADGQLTERVHAAILADGWSAAGEPPSSYEVSHCAWGVLRLALALGLLADEREHGRTAPHAQDELAPTPAGREALRLALLARAAG